VGFLLDAARRLTEADAGATEDDQSRGGLRPEHDGRGALMDVAALRTAHEDFLAMATAGGFGPPAHGEWDAERLLAHVAATDAAIASVALAAAGGQRAAYDNRASLEWNLRRIVSECGGLSGLAEFVRAQGALFCK